LFVAKSARARTSRLPYIACTLAPFRTSARRTIDTRSSHKKAHKLQQVFCLFCASLWLKAHVLGRHAFLTLRALLLLFVHPHVVFDQRLDRHAFNLTRRCNRAHDRATADDCRSEALHQGYGLFNVLATATAL